MAVLKVILAWVVVIIVSPIAMVLIGLDNHLNYLIVSHFFTGQFPDGSDIAPVVSFFATMMALIIGAASTCSILEIGEKKDRDE